MRKPTPTEKRIDELKAEIRRLESDIASDAMPTAEGFDASSNAMFADLRDLKARLAEQEKKATQARKRNRDARVRGNVMASFGMRRTADGWQ